MKCKKVFFLLYSLRVGGVEKSLINLLATLSAKECDIHIGLVWLEGEYKSLLPSNVTIHVLNDISEHWNELNDPPLNSVRNYMISNQFSKAIVAFLIYLKCKLRGSFFWWTDFVLSDSKGIAEDFDLAVAYAGPSSDIDYYICNKVQAKKKIGWIHFDISKFGIDSEMVRRLYGQYERIFVVSETAKIIFNQTFPQYKDKTEVFHNIVSPSQIKALATSGESFQDDFKGKRILTVGRISPEKGQFEAIQALKILKEKGYDIRWYFVGEGSDLERCKNEVDRLGLSKDVVFLGTQTNPYAYMRDCDIFMQPSRHEGFCITLAEALCFGNPIVATDFTGAQEQLLGRENGFVVGMSAEEIAEGIENALTAPHISIVPSDGVADVNKLMLLL